jgi:hypothetical protein
LVVAGEAVGDGLVAGEAGVVPVVVGNFAFRTLGGVGGFGGGAEIALGDAAGNAGFVGQVVGGDAFGAYSVVQHIIWGTGVAMGNTAGDAGVVVVEIVRGETDEASGGIGIVLIGA